MPKKPIVIQNQTRVIAQVLKPELADARPGRVYLNMERGMQANVFFDGDQIPTSLGKVESIKKDEKHRDPKTLRYEIHTEGKGLIELLIPQKGVSARSVRLNAENYIRKKAKRMIKN